MRKMSLLIIMVIMTLSIPTSSAQPSQEWPYSIPCRVKDGVNKDLLVMTLGDVETPLADGTFDSSKDQLTLKSGEITEHYYRDVLGIQCFVPIDKTHFPVSPSGWCTWYYYYSRINEDEVKQNARWIADNLKDYGAQYVQIDDGWQGDGGEYTERDWNRIRQSQFPSGMKPLADYIKSLGLTPGIWIAPHGQTDPEFAKAHPELFLFKPDETSASETWKASF